MCCSPRSTAIRASNTPISSATPTRRATASAPATTSTTHWATWSQALQAAIRQIQAYAADVLIVSLGVDTFKEDPISQFRLDSPDYLRMGEAIGKLGLANTTSGLVLVHVIYGLAFTTLFFRNYFVAIPDALVKAARLDGAGFFTIFLRILLPMSTPIVMVCLIWQFTQIWNDFLFGVVFASGDSQPITVALNNLVNITTGVKEYNVDMAAAMIAALPTLVVYVLAGKYFVRGLTAGAVKG